jgi:glycosyltransferase involved in cell wall biosynthesis
LSDAATPPKLTTPFTIGIPVYNEEAILVSNIERLLAYLDTLGPAYEVLIGSNGSTDNTTVIGVDLARRFAHVRFFHLPERGVGNAFREFARRAIHPYLVSVDMDLSVDIDFIEKALALLETNEIVVGSKKLGKQKRSLLRTFASDSFLRITRGLLGLTYDDYSVAAKAYRVETIRKHAEIINEGTSYVLELCFLTHRAGGRIVQIPVQCEDWRKSKFNLVHEAVYKYSHLFGLWLRSRTGRI